MDASIFRDGKRILLALNTPGHSGFSSTGALDLLGSTLEVESLLPQPPKAKSEDRENKEPANDDLAWLDLPVILAHHTQALEEGYRTHLLHPMIQHSVQLTSAEHREKTAAVVGLAQLQKKVFPGLSLHQDSVLVFGALKVAATAALLKMSLNEEMRGLTPLFHSLGSHMTRYLETMSEETLLREGHQLAALVHLTGCSRLLLARLADGSGSHSGDHAATLQRLHECLGESLEAATGARFWDQAKFGHSYSLNPERKSRKHDQKKKQESADSNVVSSDLTSHQWDQKVRLLFLSSVLDDVSERWALGAPGSQTHHSEVEALLTLSYLCELSTSSAMQVQALGWDNNVKDRFTSLFQALEEGRVGLQQLFQEADADGIADSSFHQTATLVENVVRCARYLRLALDPLAPSPILLQQRRHNNRQMTTINTFPKTHALVVAADKVWLSLRKYRELLEDFTLKHYLLGDATLKPSMWLCVKDMMMRVGQIMDDDYTTAHWAAAGGVLRVLQQVQADGETLIRGLDPTSNVGTNAAHLRTVAFRVVDALRDPLAVITLHTGSTQIERCPVMDEITQNWQGKTRFGTNESAPPDRPQDSVVSYYVSNYHHCLTMLTSSPDDTHSDEHLLRSSVSPYSVHRADCCYLKPKKTRGLGSETTTPRTTMTVEPASTLFNSSIGSVSVVTTGGTRRSNAKPSLVNSLLAGSPDNKRRLFSTAVSRLLLQDGEDQVSAFTAWILEARESKRGMEKVLELYHPAKRLSTSAKLASVFHVVRGVCWSLLDHWREQADSTTAPECQLGLQYPPCWPEADPVTSSGGEEEELQWVPWLQFRSDLFREKGGAAGNTGRQVEVAVAAVIVTMMPDTFAGSVFELDEAVPRSKEFSCSDRHGRVKATSTWKEYFHDSLLPWIQQELTVRGKTLRDCQQFFELVQAKGYDNILRSLGHCLGGSRSGLGGNGVWNHHLSRPSELSLLGDLNSNKGSSHDTVGVLRPMLGLHLFLWTDSEANPIAQCPLCAMHNGGDTLDAVEKGFSVG